MGSEDYCNAQACTVQKQVKPRHQEAVTSLQDRAKYLQDEARRIDGYVTQMIEALAAESQRAINLRREADELLASVKTLQAS